MGSSFQDEVPKSRINITLDLDTSGAINKKELPLKLMILGNFFSNKREDDDEKIESISVRADSIDQVLAKLKPRISLLVKDCIHSTNETVLLNLDFSAIKDFSPERLAAKVPGVDQLVAMRGLLKDLQANMAGNPSIKKHVLACLSSRSKARRLNNELSRLIKFDQSGGFMFGWLKGRGS